MTAPQRTRDPARRERILLAATRLAAGRGFTSVTLAEIGAEAGISGTGIYRYFRNKSALLVALINRVVDQLVADASAITAELAEPSEALRALIVDHLDAELSDREVFQVYLRDAETLPAEDLSRIKSKMRRYTAEWVRVLEKLHPGLPEPEARTIVQAAIGALQSTLNFDAHLPRETLLRLLSDAAHAVIHTASAGAQPPSHERDDRLFERF